VNGHSDACGPLDALGDLRAEHVGGLGFSGHAGEEPGGVPAPAIGSAGTRARIRR
jgi:hypothetical protein